MLRKRLLDIVLETLNWTMVSERRLERGTWKNRTWSVIYVYQEYIPITASCQWDIFKVIPTFQGGNLLISELQSSTYGGLCSSTGQKVLTNYTISEGDTWNLTRNSFTFSWKEVHVESGIVSEQMGSVKEDSVIIFKCMWTICQGCKGRVLSKTPKQVL